MATDDYDIGSDAVDRLSARNLTSGVISGLQVSERPEGSEFIIIIELLSERKVEFAASIAEALGGIPFELLEVEPRHGILYGPPPSGTNWWARRRDARIRRKIVKRHLRDARRQAGD